MNYWSVSVITHVTLFPNNYELLQKLIHEVSSQHILLMGDFNYKGINWHTFQASEPADQQFLDCVEDSFLTQHATEPTRENSVLDLVITDEPGMIDCVNVCGLFSTSDHNVLCWTTNVVARTTKNSDVIRNYNKAYIASIRKDLSHVNWELDSGRNVHELWYVFRNQIETVIKRHVPFKKLHAGKHKKVMWITTKAVRAVAKKETKRAKRNFETKLCENIKKDTKSFYAYARSQSKSKLYRSQDFEWF